MQLCLWHEGLGSRVGDGDGEAARPIRRPSMVKAAELIRFPELLSAFVALQEAHAAGEEERYMRCDAGAAPNRPNPPPPLRPLPARPGLSHAATHVGRSGCLPPNPLSK